MVMNIYTQTASYRDAKGQVGHVKFHVGGDDATVGDAQTAAQAVLDAIGSAGVTVGVTNALRVSANGPVSQEPAGGYGLAAQFQSCEDKLVIMGTYLNGASARIEIPAPKATQFEPDLETGDLAAALLAALVTAIQANVIQSRTGSAWTLTTFAGRTRRRTIRRFNSRTKNPDLNEPGL